MNSEPLHRRTTKCSFCGSMPTYYEGGQYACGNCAKRLDNPRAIDSVSPEMAKQLKEMLTDPNEPIDLDEE